MNKWKLLDKKDISPSKWFPLEQHTVELPNGKIFDDYFVSPMGEVVMIFALTKENEVIFVKQYKHGIQEIIIELPAGFIQKDKNKYESAIAELEEEVGIRVSQDQLIDIGKVFNMPTKTNNATNYFLVKDVEFNSTQNFDETEDIEIIKIPIKELFSRIKNKEIKVGDTLACILKVYLEYPDLFV